MTKRKILKLFGLLGVGFMGILYLKPWFLRKLYYKIESLFRFPMELPPESERRVVKFPDEGFSISVETALNSRCNSDYDGNPKNFHWGMFDKTQKISDDQISKFVAMASLPRFTDRNIEIRSEGNVLTFMIDNRASGILRDWLMVESGMQQQAIGLVCAALGVGMVFKSLGDDGSAVSDTTCATIKVKLDAMKPTYDGSFWTRSFPSGEKPWLKGSLPDPVRDGKKPLILALEGLKIKKNGGFESTDDAVSQILWAARGRTPHFYKSRPWGMTIPVSRGEQNISSIYYVKDNKISRYVNWYNNRPTHSLEVMQHIDIDSYNELIKLFPLHKCFIVIGKNEKFDRALWEVGYQLLNLMVQADALNLSYEAVLLNENQKNAFRHLDIEDPVAAFLVKGKD